MSYPPTRRVALRSKVALMGTIVNGQSHAIATFRFAPRQSIIAFLQIRSVSKKASDVSLLSAIHNLRRACTVLSVFRGAIYSSHLLCQRLNALTWDGTS